MAKKGEGSLAHNDRWYLFDQILFSPAWKQRSRCNYFKQLFFTQPICTPNEGATKVIPSVQK